MIREDYPDDCVTQTVPGGRPPVALGAMAIDPVAFEEEEPESPEAAIGYGSLLSLGTSMRKKKPLIVVDPVEAENEARRVQFVAAQQLVDPDEADGIAFRECLAQFAEPDDQHADDAYAPVDEQGDAWAVDREAGDEMASDAECPADADSDGDLRQYVEVPDDLDASVDAVEDAAGTPEGEVPIAIDTPAPQSSPAPPGHSLRARMPTRPPRRTLADRAVAFLGWLYNWLTRPR